MLPKGECYPILHLVFDTSALGVDGVECSCMLRNGRAGVFVNEGLLHQDTLIINPINLDQRKTENPVEQLRNVLRECLSTR